MTSYPAPPVFADHVLIASPNRGVRQRVIQSLYSPHRRFEHASGGAEALMHLESGPWRMLFLDPKLPDLNAEELSQTVRRRFPEVEVVMLDSEREAGPQDEASDAVARKETSSAILSGAVEDAVASGEASIAEPRREAPLPGMIGESLAMQPVYQRARLLARRNTAVLITGPTGAGKEIVARAIHQLSPRTCRSFVVVNCAAIPETLLEAELFGYARGAFTGAMQSYAGRIQAAQGGTLFLDEIGEMPLSLQPKLLRFLEQKELQRLGSAEVVRVDVRVVSATNAHLLTLVREGKFREDLYYRLCGFPVEIPPLRERSEDVALLAAHFLKSDASRASTPRLSAAAAQILRAQPWPGNIRELQNVMERALVLSEEAEVILPEHLMLGETNAEALHPRAKNISFCAGA